ncbi:hypothetical protein B0H10DRAFT_1960122, partial [Mycena sp. CBHHK59/15]
CESCAPLPCFSASDRPSARTSDVQDADFFVSLAPRSLVSLPLIRPSARTLGCSGCGCICESRSPLPCFSASDPTFCSDVQYAVSLAPRSLVSLPLIRPSARTVRCSESRTPLPCFSASDPTFCSDVQFFDDVVVALSNSTNRTNFLMIATIIVLRHVTLLYLNTSIKREDALQQAYGEYLDSDIRVKVDQWLTASPVCTEQQIVDFILGSHFYL